MNDHRNGPGREETVPPGTSRPAYRTLSQGLAIERWESEGGRVSPRSWEAASPEERAVAPFADPERIEPPVLGGGEAGR